MNTVFYSEKQLDLLLEAATLLIPVCTGYIVLVAGSIQHLQERGILREKANKRRLVSTFVTGLVALGLWTGTLAFMVDCAYPYARQAGAGFSLSSERLNLEWDLGQLCAQGASIAFFISVSLYASIAVNYLSATRDTK